MKNQALPSVLLDENVAGLAKWLRFLGFNTEIALQETPDNLVLQKALDEKRILITRDQELIQTAPSTVVLAIDSDYFDEQIVKCLKRLGVPKPKYWFSLCTICNVELSTLRPEQIAASPLIPKFVKESHDPEVKCAWRCTNCDRVYWKGSHFERTRAILMGLTAKMQNQGDSGTSPSIDI